MADSVVLSLPNLEATRSLGLALGRSLPPGTILLLEGNLGSGKTTLVQSIGEALGITDAIVSPTFTLINEYSEGRIPLYHFDLYRLEPQEVAALQVETYWDEWETPPGIVAIEWADRLPELPTHYLQICFAIETSNAGENLIEQRMVTLTPVGKVSAELLDVMQNLGALSGDRHPNSLNFS